MRSTLRSLMMVAALAGISLAASAVPVDTPDPWRDKVAHLNDSITSPAKPAATAVTQRGAFVIYSAYDDVNPISLCSAKSKDKGGGGKGGGGKKCLTPAVAAPSDLVPAPSLWRT